MKQFILLGNTSFSTVLQREQSLAISLARKGYKVVYIEGMPSVASIIRAKIRRYFSKESIEEHPVRDEHIDKKLEILIPPIVPTFFRSSWTPKYDALIFRRWFINIFKTQKWSETVVLVMFPYWWYGFVDKNICPAKIFIYDICDALEMPSRNAIALKRMIKAEQMLVKDVKAITFSAFEMSENIKIQYPLVKQYCLPNAITDAFLQNVKINEKTEKLTIGYLGFLDPRWADRELLLKVAKTYTNCSIIIRSSMDKIYAERLRENKNVKIIGFQKYNELPNLVSSFSVGIIPFLINEFTAVINPLKLYEYCAAGIPIVAMMTPELRHYKDIIYLAETHDEFIICIEKALKENDDSKRRQRIEFAQNNTWDKRIETLLNIVNHEI